MVKTKTKQSFKEYYLIEVKSEIIFEKTLTKYYNKGFFGNITFDIIKDSQKNWYDQFMQFIIERNKTELSFALIESNSKINKEYFSKLTGINIVYKNKKETIKILENYIGY